MPDVDVSPVEEDRLRALLHRAVDDLHIEADGATWSVAEITPLRRRRRTPLLAAAAAVLVVAVGVTGWVLTDSDERIDTAPAELVDPRVVEQSGIWRLPTEDSGFDVAEAMESTVRLPLQIAVDDPAAPSRLLAIVPGGYDLAAQPASEPTVPFTEHTTMTLLRGDSAADASWLEVTGTGQTGYLTFASIGLSDEEVQSLARSLVEAIGDAPGVLTDTARVDAALSSFRPPTGLVPTWDPNEVGLGPNAYDEDGPVTSIGLRLVRTHDERDIGLSIRRTSLPQAVAMEWHRIQATSPVTAPTDVNGPPRRLTERRDLGRGVLVDTLDGVDTVTVITDDGTEITAQTVLSVVRDQSGVEPLSLEEQLDIINSLRALGEDEFRARLDAAGVPIRDPRDLVDDEDSAGSGSDAPTTTVLPTPTTAVLPTPTTAGG